MMSSKPGGGIGRTTSDGITQRHPHMGGAAGVGSRRRVARERYSAQSAKSGQRFATWVHSSNLHPPGIVERSIDRVPPAAALAIRTTSPFGFPSPETTSGTVARTSVRPVGVLAPSLSPGLTSSSRVPAFSPARGKVHEAGYNIVLGANQQRDAFGYSRIGCFFNCNLPVSCNVLKSCTRSMGEPGKNAGGYA
jgi:hypothetical protein